MTDRHYFERRLAEELDAASASADPRAAAAHLALARAYLLRLEWVGRRRSAA